MSQYNFKIMYVKGTENARADALSRRVDYVEAKVYEPYQLLREEEDGLVFASKRVCPVYTVASDSDQAILNAYDSDDMAE